MSMDKMIPLMLGGIKDTLYMTTVSTLFAYLLGLPLAILLVLTAPSGLKPQKLVYRLLDTVVNIFRSIPFLILMILVIPVTRAIAGKAYGSTATIVPLVIAAAPYVARMIESSLLEVDPGVIEAAQSMGANIPTIIFKVLIPEAKTSLIVGATISLRHDSRLQRDVRRDWRRRSGADCHQLRLQPLSDGRTLRHRRPADRADAGHPDRRHEDFPQDGQARSKLRTALPPLSDSKPKGFEYIPKINNKSNLLIFRRTMP